LFKKVKEEKEENNYKNKMRRKRERRKIIIGFVENRGKKQKIDTKNIN